MSNKLLRDPRGPLQFTYHATGYSGFLKARESCTSRIYEYTDIGVRLNDLLNRSEK